MSRKIKTPGGTLEDGERYELELQHGIYSAENIRALNTLGVLHGHKEGDPVTDPAVGLVRLFDQDGEMRCEVITDEVEGYANLSSGERKTIYRTVGFLPEHVLKATAA